MGYAIRSEIYFAVDATDFCNIKIGETTNSNRRQGQLQYCITRSVGLTEYNDSRYDKAKRLFIESYIRAKMLKRKDCRLTGEDYFTTTNAKTAEEIEELFVNWVEEAEEVFNNLV